MKDNLKQGLSPILFVARVFGLVVFEYPAGHLRPKLSVSYILIKWISYGLLTSYVTIKFPRNMDFEDYVWLFLKSGSVFVAVSSTISGVYHRETLQNCLATLQAADDTLEKLGAPKEYSKLFKFLIAFLITLIVFHLTCAYHHAKSNLDAYKSLYAFILPWLYNYPPLLNAIAETLFWILLGYTGIQFNKINDCIENLECERKYDKRWCREISLVPPVSRNSANTEKCKHTIRILMQMHLQLCKLSQVINNMFEAHVCMEAGYCFVLSTMILVYLFRLFSYFFKQRASFPVIEFLVLCMWGTRHIARIICTNCLCENVIEKANRTKDITNKLLNTVVDEEVRKDGIQFTLQVLQRPLKFTGLGLFDLGYDFIKKFFTFLTTVIILLLQIRHFPDEGNAGG